MIRGQKQTTGFTIVELLIVVVVIAILAAITIVAYTGISQQARESALASELSSVQRKLQVSSVQSGNGVYPLSLTGVEPTESEASFRYYTNSQTNPTSFCVEAENSGTTYFTTKDVGPTDGRCADNYGLLGWWKLDSLADSSGNGRMLTNAGAATLATGQSGGANSAYGFNDVTTSYLTANGAASAIANKDALTITGWVYPSNNPTTHDGYFGVRHDVVSEFYVLQLINTNNLECRIRNASTIMEAGTVTIQPNQWNFVALVYTGTGITCYVDAVPGTTSNVTATLPESTQPFRIGAANYTMTGSIDDVRLYGRALTREELVRMYDAGAY